MSYICTYIGQDSHPQGFGLGAQKSYQVYKKCTSNHRVELCLRHVIDTDGIVHGVATRCVYTRRLYISYGYDRAVFMYIGSCIHPQRGQRPSRMKQPSSVCMIERNTERPSGIRYFEVRMYDGRRSPTPEQEASSVHTSVHRNTESPNVCIIRWSEMRPLQKKPAAYVCSSTVESPTMLYSGVLRST